MWNYISFLILVLPFGTDAKSSTVGKHFVFGILNLNTESYRDVHNIVSIDVTNASPGDAKIHLNASFVNIKTNDTIRTGQSKTFNIPYKIQRDGTFKDARGIEITADDDISVMVTNTYNSADSIDVYNVFPTVSLGKRYILSSYHGIGESGFGSEFMVTGIYDNTNVTYFGSNSSSSIILNSLEVYQVLCSGHCDMTGYLLISDKDIYVTSGTSLAYVPSGSRNEDYLASEMIPTSNWMRSYIVPPVIPQPFFMLRVISEYDSRVTISNTSRSYTIISNLQDQFFQDLPVLLTSDKPIGITQYGLQRESDQNGDPFITVVPGINQYINDYYFSVPHAYYGNVIHYVAIIVLKAIKDQLVVDNQTVQSHNRSTGTIKMLDVPYPFDNFTVLQFEIKEGVHHFWHPNTDVTFGVFVYGLGQYLAYGFYAGYDIEGKEASAASIQTSTVETSSTLTTNTVTTTGTTSSTLTYTMTPTATTKIVATTASFMPEGQMCYQCKDLTHPDLCDTVRKCSRNEMCFVEMYTESGQRKYHSGCLEGNICQANKEANLHLAERCFECCHGNYCNNKGCGEAVIPDRNNRGPICFDCQHVSSPDECHKVIPCDRHQVCRIEETKWFDHSNFKMDCGLCDPVSRTSFANHVLKRAVPLCYSCCNDDYCNRNCTNNVLPSGPNIIG